MAGGRWRSRTLRSPSRTLAYSASPAGSGLGRTRLAPAMVRRAAPFDSTLRSPLPATAASSTCGCSRRAPTAECCTAAPHQRRASNRLRVDRQAERRRGGLPQGVRIKPERRRVGNQSGPVRCRALSWHQQPALATRIKLRLQATAFSGTGEHLPVHRSGEGRQARRQKDAKESFIRFRWLANREQRIHGQHSARHHHREPAPRPGTSRGTAPPWCRAG